MAKEDPKKENEPTKEASPEDGDGSTATATAPQPEDSEFTESDKQMLRVHHELTGTQVPDYLKEEAEAKPEPAATESDSDTTGADTVQDEPSEKGTEAKSAPSKDGEPAEAPKEPDPKEVAKYKDALRKWQWDDKMIDQAPLDLIIERGKDAVKSQSDHTRVNQEKADFKRKFEEAMAELDQAKAKPSPEAASPTDSKPDPQPTKAPEINLDEILKPLADDDIYSDIVEPIKKAFGAVMEQARPASELAPTTSPAEPPENGQAKLVQSLYDEMDNLRMDLARSRLTADIPDLADETKFESVRARAYQLANLNGYHDDRGNPNVEKLLRDAARLELGETQPTQTTNKVKGDLQESFLRQTAGQPMDGGRAPEPTSGMTRDEKMIKAQEYLAQGLQPDDIRAKLAAIPDA